MALHKKGEARRPSGEARRPSTRDGETLINKWVHRRLFYVKIKNTGMNKLSAAGAGEAAQTMATEKQKALWPTLKTIS